MHFVVYEKTDCSNCMRTMALLRGMKAAVAVNYYGDENKPNLADFNTTDPTKVAYRDHLVSKLKDRYNAMAFPVVKVVDKDNNIIDYWDGFNPKKIFEYGKKTDPTELQSINQLHQVILKTE